MSSNRSASISAKEEGKERKEEGKERKEGAASFKRPLAGVAHHTRKSHISYE